MGQKQVKIFCVHQGGELYGSDRSFLQVVTALRESYSEAHIKVLLAVDGPLVPLLREVSDELIVRDIVVLRLAELASTLWKLSIGLPYYLLMGVIDIHRADLVYINTSVIADFMLLARLSPKRYILHIREIPKPHVMPIIRYICRFSRARILYNSHATSLAFGLPPTQAQHVVHNGSDRIAEATPPIPPRQFSAKRPLRIAMLGRISNWKGQDLLIAALARLPVVLRKQFHVRIVGSVYGEDQSPLDVLRHQIAGAGLEACISLEPFRDDPNEVYCWSDLCVVPSRLPEPFGRVAIESMAWGRPVIAAAHGGLMEIIEDNVTGWLAPPNDENALASIIERILANPSLVHETGKEALDRFHQQFSTEAMRSNLIQNIQQWFPHLGNPINKVRPPETATR